MASNFAILTHKNADNIHLKLKGDFDGTSAHELVNYLGERCQGFGRIFVHTAALGHVDEFGVRMFRYNLGRINGTVNNLHFTGEHAGTLFPGQKPGKGSVS